MTILKKNIRSYRYPYFYSPHGIGIEIEAGKEVTNHTHPPNEMIRPASNYGIDKTFCTLKYEHHLKVNGTAIGTRMATVVCGQSRKNIIPHTQRIVVSWFEIIYDIDMNLDNTENKNQSVDSAS